MKKHPHCSLAALLLAAALCPRAGGADTAPAPADPPIPPYSESETRDRMEQAKWEAQQEAQAPLMALANGFNTGDLKSAAAVVVGANPDDPLLAELARQIGLARGTFKLTVNVVEAPGGDGRVTFIESLRDHLGENVVQTETLTLVPRTETGLFKWKMVMADPRGAMLDWKTGMLGRLAAEVRDPKFALVAEDAGKSMANLSDLAMGTLRQVDAAGWCCDLSPATWRPKLLADQVAAESFVPPGGNPSLSYSFNGKLTGHDWNDIDDRHDTVLIYEGKDGALDFGRDGFAAVAFADGSVDLIDARAATELKWTP